MQCLLGFQVFFFICRLGSYASTVSVPMIPRIVLWCATLTHLSRPFVANGVYSLPKKFFVRIHTKRKFNQISLLLCCDNAMKTVDFVYYENCNGPADKHKPAYLHPNKMIINIYLKYKFMHVHADFAVASYSCFSVKSLSLHLHYLHIELLIINCLIKMSRIFANRSASPARANL